MSSASTVPMLSPDGDPGDVPQEHVQDAVKAGFQVSQDMLSPDGKPGHVPLGKVHDAIKAGFKVAGAPPKLPQPDMQNAGVTVPDAGRIPGQATGSNQVTDKQAGEGVAAGAAAGGAALGGSAAVGALPAVLPHTIEGVKAITKWAEAHPVHAYALYNIMKELVPGAKKTIGLVKGAPGE
jgi:hypothetical protein